ncbi:MAG TPA: hypothetical protein VMR52_03965 [Dehalococcoidia bacterium]|nr:hypothetical protein [Dehalococcoidia bacterium]
MTVPTSAAMALIENERRRDHFIRRTSIIAWSVTVALVLVIAIMVGFQVSQFVSGALEGEVPWAVVIGSTMPLIDVLWKLSLLVATLSTVAIFVRLRTSSLAEIQLRLASLEEMVASGERKREERIT